MKFLMIILIILMSGCASQNNQNTQNLPSYNPDTQIPAQTQAAATATAKKATETTEQQSQQDVPEPPETTTDVAKKDPVKKAVKKTTVPAKPARKKKEDIYKNNYVCDFEKIYKVYSAESTDNAEGQLKVNIYKDIVTIEVIAPQIRGTYKLKLRSSTGMSMIATNKAMVYQYTFYPQKFTFNTGIAESGFDLARGGHQGNQMRVSGKCH